MRLFVSLILIAGVNLKCLLRAVLIYEASLDQP